MKICDRTLAISGEVVKADHEIQIGAETFHLCSKEFDAVRQFVVEPPKPPKRGRPRKDSGTS